MKFKSDVASDAVKNDDKPIVFYDIEVFNQCEQSQNLMVTIECWKDVHPALVTLPVDWDHPIPYGILYAKEPDADVTHFIETVKKAQEKNM